MGKIDWNKPLELLDGTPVMAVMGSASGPLGVGPSKDTSHRWLLGVPGYPYGYHVLGDDPSYLRNRKEVASVPTLRDQFAMATLTCFCDPDYDWEDYETMAIHAYRVADAMIAARENGKDEI